MIFNLFLFVNHAFEQRILFLVFWVFPRLSFITIQWILSYQYYSHFQNRRFSTSISSLRRAVKKLKMNTNWKRYIIPTFTHSRGTKCLIYWVFNQKLLIYLCFIFVALFEWIQMKIRMDFVERYAILKTSNADIKNKNVYPIAPLWSV